MKRSTYIAYALLLLVPAVAILPVGRVAVEWLQFSQVVGADLISPGVQGYDWVVWQDNEGVIEAGYVSPRGPAAEGGLQKGDVFFELNYQQFFNVEDLRQAIEGIEPGSMNTYSVLRDGEFAEINVRFSRYPTFLYPLSMPLWQFAIWGFLFGCFLHTLGLGIVGPLAVRSSRARFSLLLILVSSLWMYATALRLLLAELIGPPLAPGGTYDFVWQALTLVGLVGWIGFPALLLHKVLYDTGLLRAAGLHAARFALYVPAFFLLLGALFSTLFGTIGPFTQMGLVAPILFHGCWYIAVAAALMLSYNRRADAQGRTAGQWNRAGSLVTLVLASLAAAAVAGMLPVQVTEMSGLGAWLVICTQLLAVAPILLVTLATLKHGKVDQVLSRGIAYLTVLGLIFFAYVGGTSLLDPYLHRQDAPHNVVGALYVIILLLIFERVARRLRLFTNSFFATERQRTRQMLSHFQEHMRDIVSPEMLIQQTVDTAGEAFQVKFAVLFLQSRESGAWISASYRPEPPYLTERVLSMVWPSLEAEGKVWARNPELNESLLPPNLARLLEARGGYVASPIMGESKPIGVLVLGAKRPHRAVFNLEDLDLLRVLGSQLTLAMERLALIQRQQALVRESAEAQLVALRAQINPHFLFNALNTIVSLIEETPDEAEETVQHLAAIFRHILHTSSQPYVTLEDELTLVNHYLSIEQARFGPKLTVDVQMEPALRGFPVPAFAVQTLVENAVKHGLEKRRTGGLLRIVCSETAEGGATVAVSDSGVGIPSLMDAREGHSATHFYGIGLRNVHARLEQLYGGRGELRITSRAEEGTTARLLLPPPETVAVLPGTLPEHTLSPQMSE